MAHSFTDVHMLPRIISLLVALLFAKSSIFAQDVDSLSDQLIGEVFNEGVVVDLRQPLYSDGVLTTDQGGVICGPNIRVQAQHIVYTRKLVDGEEVFCVEAEGNLMVEYLDRVFVGERVEYNFLTREGIVYEGRGAITPWYVGGETIYLCADGSYLVYDAYLTTSANVCTEWQIQSSEVRILSNSNMRASNVQFRFVNLPLLWIPSYRANLKTMWRMPIRYHARWSGRLGPRVGLRYQLYNSEEWQTFLLLDYSFVRGLGGGIETDYREPCGERRFFTRSYIANDNSVEQPNRRERYRFAGTYHDQLDSGITFDLAYDKLSDKWMASDYYQKGFDSRAIGRSQLAVRKESCDWIAGVYAHARLNDFQSVKQELPTFAGSVRPLNLFYSGIISETSARMSYLSFRYDKDLRDVTNFQSSRFEVRETLYYPLSFGAATVTPEGGIIAIHYGDSPQDNSVDQIVGIARLELTTDLHRFYGCYKHGLSPYAWLSTYSASAIPVDETYLFDIDDGWDNLHLVRFGLRQTLYEKLCDDSIRRRLYGDLYTNVFLQADTMDHALPYVYGRLWWYSSDQVRYLLDGAWDTARGEVAYYNLRTEYTINEDIAFAVEFRHRSDYAWRKVDYENYFVDVFHTEAELLNSTLSDQRNTLLAHLFYRIDYTWALELRSRYGWLRRDQSDYLEYQADLHRKLRGGWQIRLSYQHREDDDRFAVNIGLGADPPTYPCFETPELAYGNR